MPSPRARWPWPGDPELYWIAAWTGFIVRYWQLSGHRPSWWQDSFDYAAVGDHPLWSGRLLWGARPPLVSYLVAVTGGAPGNGYMWLQAVLAALAWAALAVQVSTLMPTSPRRWAIAIAVVAFSLTTPVTLWDRSVLSESLGISLMVAVVAAGIWCLRRPGPLQLAALVLAALAWVHVRDSDVVVVGLLAMCVGVAGWVLRARGADQGRRRLVAIGALALALAATSAVVSASAGQRSTLPMADVYSVRVLPYPARLHWFLDHGMPDLDRFHPTGPVAPATAPVVYLPRPGEDPAMDEWWSWFDARGRTTWLEWVATHPAYLVTEPLQRPERVFNNADGTVMGYEGAGDSRVPAVTSLLWLPTIPTAAVAAILLGGVLWWRRRAGPLLIAAAFCVLSSGPFAFVAWHTGGMESARHLFLAAVLLRVGALLAVAAALEVLPVREPTAPVVPPA